MSLLRWKLGWALLLAPVIAQATIPLCLVNFGTLSADTPEELELLAESTYRQLWETPYAAKLPQALIQRVIEGGDPFHVPELEGADVFSLGKQLGQFRQMLEAKRANTETLRGKLIAQLTQRITGQNQAEQKIGDVAPLIAPDITFPKSDRKKLFPIPGTTDFVMQQFGPHGIPNRYRTEHVDGRTGKVTEWEAAPHFPIRFFPSSDGKQLYLIRKLKTGGHELVKAPLTPDGPKWEGAPVFPLPETTFEDLGKAELATIAGKDFILVARDWTKSPWYKLAAETGEVTKLDAVHSDRWQSIPGSDAVAVTKSIGKGAIVKLGHVGERGIEFTSEVKSWPHTRNPNVAWRQEKGPVILYDYEHARLYLPGGKQSLILSVIPPEQRNQTFETFITKVAVAPDGNTAAVLISPQGVKQAAGQLGQHIAWVDINTQKVIARISTREGGQIESIEFAPDGRLFTDDHGTPAILNLEGRR